MTLSPDELAITMKWLDLRSAALLATVCKNLHQTRRICGPIIHDFNNTILYNEPCYIIEDREACNQIWLQILMTLLRVVKQLESEDPKLALPGVVNPRRLVPVDPPKLWRADEAFCGQLRRDVVNFSHQPRLAYLRTVQEMATYGSERWAIGEQLSSVAKSCCRHTKERPCYKTCSFWEFQVDGRPKPLPPASLLRRILHIEEDEE